MLMHTLEVYAQLHKKGKKLFAIMRGENNIITNYSFCNAQIFYRKIMANQSVSKVFIQRAL